MGFKKVMVPYDNSEHAHNALRKAIELVDNSPESEIHVIQVMAPPQDLVFSSFSKSNYANEASSLSSKEMFSEVVEERTAEGSQGLQDRIAAMMSDYQGTLKAEIVYGVYVVDTIVDAAKQYEVDAIAMGSRGLGAIRGMIGSVSYGVLRSSDVPILIVK